MSGGRLLPGDLSRERQVERMIRVDHAGEFGAARIYAGQLAVLRRSGTAPVLRQMQAQEQQHLKAFEQLVAERRVRPTALLPVWSVAGFALGAATAALGPRAAMACTAAVEEVIDTHYAAQIVALSDEPKLRDTIAAFRAEEIEHRDIALAHEAERAPAYRLLSSFIRLSCKAAIAISKRF